MKRLTFLDDVVWLGIEKLTYYVLFPALLIHTLGLQKLSGTEWWTLSWISIAVLLIVSLAVWLVYRLKPAYPAEAFTSIFQGSVRYNTYIALSVSSAYFGSQGLAVASLNAGFMIIVINLLCVSIFAVYGKTKSQNASDFIKQIIRNPLILGCVAGWFLSLSGIGLPSVTEDFVEILGRAALPLGLLAVGASLKPKSLVSGFLPVTISIFFQFIAKPVLVLLLGNMAGVSQLGLGILLISFSVPTASSSYILARQLGGDVDAMASIITLQTMVAFIAMPIWAAAFLT
ncbi:MAG: AEC family transporter [Reinekea sp.]